MYWRGKRVLNHVCPDFCFILLTHKVLQVGIGAGRGLPLPPRDEPWEVDTAPAWRSVEAFSQAGQSPVTPTIFGGHLIDGRHFKDENSPSGRLRTPKIIKGEGKSVKESASIGDSWSG